MSHQLWSQYGMVFEEHCFPSPLSGPHEPFRSGLEAVPRGRQVSADSSRSPVRCPVASSPSIASGEMRVQYSVLDEKKYRHGTNSMPVYYSQYIYPLYLGNRSRGNQ